MTLGVTVGSGVWVLVEVAVIVGTVVVVKVGDAEAGNVGRSEFRGSSQLLF